MCAVRRPGVAIRREAAIAAAQRNFIHIIVSRLVSRVWTSLQPRSADPNLDTSNANLAVGNYGHGQKDKDTSNYPTHVVFLTFDGGLSSVTRLEIVRGTIRSLRMQ